jgi:hypothetical protein
VLCIFNDAGTLIGEDIVDRAGQMCGTKPCWKPTGKQGLMYKDKTGNADGIVQITYVGGDATKGKAGAKGKNDAAHGMTHLPTGLAAALAGNTVPTIELVTSDGLCVGATMNTVSKDTGNQYKAKKQ